MPDARPPVVGLVRPWRGAPSPLAALRSLASHPHPFLRWACGGPRDLARWSFAGVEPREVLSIRMEPGGAEQDPWKAIGERWPRRVRRLGPRVPFGGGWFGMWGYELRSSIERAPPPRRPPDGFPALWLARHDAVLAWDGRTGRAYLAGTGPTAAAAGAAIDRLRERLRAAGRGPAPPPPGPPRGRIGPCVSPAGYRRRVADAMERIRAGDLFQANLSQRFEGRWRASALDLFERLVAASPAPYATYLDVGGGRAVLSVSPESFLTLAGRRARTRPMKGTRPRGPDRARDRALALALERSEKDRAELAMIVDLARNDLGRSCEPGSVRVVRARRLERYATVHQAVATVEGRLAAGRDGVDLVRGAFPPGSVTGAPKVEAMVAIDEIEGEARGPYCGALGWLDEGGDLDLSVAIRTVCLARGRVSYRVGGGVTLLSDPREEHAETLDKGLALARAIAGGPA